MNVVRGPAIVFVVFRHPLLVPLEEQSLLFSWTVPFFFVLTGGFGSPEIAAETVALGRFDTAGEAEKALKA